MLACYQCPAYSNINHRFPSPEGLLPERCGPCELAVLDHLVIASPCTVDQNIEPAPLGADTFKGSGYGPVVGRITLDWYDTGTEIARIGRTSSGVYREPRIGERQRHTFSDTSCRARHQRDSFRLRMHFHVGVLCVSKSEAPKLSLPDWRYIDPKCDCPRLPCQGHQRCVGASRLDHVTQVLSVRHLHWFHVEPQCIERRFVVESTPLPRHSVED